MTISTSAIEEAGRLVAAGDDGKALQILHGLVEASDDRELRQRVHELAVAAHDSSRGFQKIEWHRLVIETDS